MTDYPLWEVILNGDSPAPTRVIKGVLQPVAPTTAEQRTHTLIWRNKTDLEEQSLDDLFNSLKIYEAEGKSSSSTSTSIQNIAFVSSSNIDSTNEPVSATASVSAIDADDLEEMDLKWQMAMWSVTTAIERDTLQGSVAMTEVFNQKRSLPTMLLWHSYLYVLLLTMRYQSGNGYHAVPPPYTRIFMPSKPDLVLSTYHKGLGEDKSKTKSPQNVPSFVQPTEQVKSPRPSVQYVETSILVATPKLVRLKPTSNGKHRNRKACFLCKSLDHLIKDCDYHENRMAQPTTRNHAQRGNHKHYARMSLPNPQKHEVPAVVLTQSKLVPITAVRLVSTVVPKTSVTRPSQAKTVVTKTNSPPRRHINRSPSPKASTFPPKVTAVKAPKGNPRHALKDKGVIDSGCSRHMTGNMSYLSNFEELNGGYVAFGGNPKSGKISGKRTLIEATRTMLADSILPIPFWDEAVNTACYVQNRVLVTKPHNKTPYELLHGRTSSIGFMRPFGCPVTILNTLDSLVKFDGKVDERFLVGYSVSSKAFRVFNSRTRIVQETLHINFLENKPNVAGSGPTWLFDIDTLTKTINYQPVTAGNQSNHSNTDEDATFDEKELEFKGRKPESKVNVSPSSSAQSKKHDDKTKREAKGKSPVESFTGYRNLSAEFKDFFDNSINKDNAAGTLIPAVGQISLNSTNTFSAACPSNVAASSTHGKSACIGTSQLPDDPDITELEDITYSDDEDDVGVEADFNNLETSITVLVDLPHRKRASGTKWVFRNKKDERGIVVRNKAQFVVQGHTQKEGIDYEEVFTLVARIEAIRLFLAYASFMGFMKYQMDVKNAFLYGSIEEEVYVCQPLGFEDLDCLDKIYKVFKVLYGLHQAPRAWYETLTNYLLENGFQRGKIDKTLFIKRQKGDILLVQIYVDDIIFGSTNKDLVKAFEKLMKDKFQMSSMGELIFFLGLQVKQKKDGIFISQDKYVAEILRKFGLTDRKSTSTPIDTKKHLLKDPDGEDVDVHTYRSIIGSLMYLTSSRPDIMFAVCACAHFQVTPKASHLHAVKRIFRYLKGKPHLGLWYPKDSPFDLVVYSDSDYAGASLDRKSTTRGCQFLGCRFISW
nr:putative ribonuclease H-like domain-containing protein [Tanacetum cinerariifolium]